MHEVVMAHPGHDGRRPRRSRTRSLSQAGKILNFLGTGGAKKIEFELIYLQFGAASCVNQAQLPVELSENMLQNLFYNLPPQTVQQFRTFIKPTEGTNGKG